MKNPRRKVIPIWPIYAYAGACWIIIITAVIVKTAQALLGS